MVKGMEAPRCAGEMDAFHHVPGPASIFTQAQLSQALGGGEGPQGSHRWSRK